ncbi:MAG: hypothetical protein R3B06_17200 [Kofleriaceae bacterium]
MSIVAVGAIAATSTARAELARAPFDPYRSASSFLQADFQACQLAAYPAVVVGDTKLQPIVRFAPSKRPKTRARLTFEVAHADGTPAALTAAQRRFTGCVTRRFQARRYLIAGGGPGPVALAGPMGDPVDSAGALDLAMARAYASARATAIRGRCPRPRQAYEATLTIGADGKVSRVALAPNDRSAGCLMLELPKRLRFPVTATATTLVVRL